MRVKRRSHKFIPHKLLYPPYVAMHKALERINKHRIDLSRGPFDESACIKINVALRYQI